MARDERKRRIALSVLDRLLDDDPDVQHEPPRDPRPLLRELRAAVRRDLESLLNTRQRVLPIPKELEELRRSSFTYGVPDMSSANLSSRSARLALIKQIEASIKAHETRFKSVAVESRDKVEPIEREMRFRIAAVLWAEPAPDMVAFDSRVENASRAVSVREEG